MPRVNCGGGEQFGRDFEVEYLRSFENASAACCSGPATAQPDLEAGVMWAAATFRFRLGRDIDSKFVPHDN